MSSLHEISNREIGQRWGGGWGGVTPPAPQGADPPPSALLLRVEKAGRNHLNEVIIPGRAIQPNHIKFRTCALAPMLTPPYKRKC
jgi:hypothetical protein